MAKGYLSLSNESVAAEVINVPRVTEHPNPPSGHAPLRLVATDRRSPGRPDYTQYRIPHPPRFSPYAVFKRSFDIVGSIACMLVLSPLLAVIAVGSLSTGGSPLFRHRRVGKDGRFFDCLKFRTMVINADEVLEQLLKSDANLRKEWAKDHKLKNDPRITKFGRFLRKTSLDELPQFWNVLCGDMSLVGPRPVVPDELQRYGTRIPIYLSARPGVTGLWQVSGRNDMPYRRRVALDVCYIRSRSVTLDLYVLAKTLPAVFAKSGAY